MRFGIFTRSAVAALLTAGVAVAQAPTPAPAATAPSATAPAAAATTTFFPTKVGTKWVYKVNNDSFTVKVSAAGADGVRFTTEANDKVVAEETYLVKADGVYRTRINKNDITPPVQILKLVNGVPAAKGEKWQVNSKVADSPIKGDFFVKDDKEKVKVPMTETEAILVDGPDFDIAGSKTSVKYWFANGIGIIKLTYNIAGSDATLELKEFTEPKDGAK